MECSHVERWLSRSFYFTTYCDERLETAMHYLALHAAVTDDLVVPLGGSLTPKP